LNGREEMALPEWTIHVAVIAVLAIAAGLIIFGVF
jgi:hypothetical protein